jgi:ABC-type lipoprotein export system ATPase subunit
MEELIHARRASMRVLFPDSAVDEEEAADRATADSFNRKLNVEQNSEFVRRIQQAIKDNDQAVNEIYKSTAMEIRLKELTYQVPVMEEEQRKIHTIYNSSPLYKLQKAFKSMNTKKNKEEEWCNVLTSVNLVLKPQTMYLVLGPPSSGKTSLLKAIAGMLSAKDAKLSGKVLYNNITVLGEGENTNKSLFQNLVAFVRQMDIHAARLTVNETFRFASHCKDSREKDEKERRVKMTLDALGIGHVMNTFVGDETVRGVSGGQRRRVTLGEVSVLIFWHLLCTPVA